MEQLILYLNEKKKKPKISNTIILNDADTNKKNTYIEDFDETSNTLFLSFMNNEKNIAINLNYYFLKMFIFILLKI